MTAQYAFVYIYPSTLMVALAALIVVNLNRERLMANHRRLTGVGLRSRPLRVAMSLSLLAAGLVAVVGGAIAGLALASLVRLIVLPAVIDQPLSPIAWPIAATGTMLAVAVAVFVVTAAVGLRPDLGVLHALTRTAAAVPWPLLRRSRLWSRSSAASRH